MILHADKNKKNIQELKKNTKTCFYSKINDKTLKFFTTMPEIRKVDGCFRAREDEISTSQSFSHSLVMRASRQLTHL